MDPVSLMLFIIAGGVLVGVCVHFIPASAVGAMSASTGIATGPSMLSFGAGLTGILSGHRPFHALIRRRTYRHPVSFLCP